MKDPLISIIIPIYNTDSYLDKCIKSVVNQTYKNLEIILVDDGSTDNSGKKCDEWADKDSRIKVIHQENKGVSAARNAGLDYASGEYIAFIDGDDYVDREYIDTLYNNIYDFDIVIAGHLSIKENGIIINKNDIDEIKNIQIPDELRMLLRHSTVWGQLIRKNTVGNTRFDTRYCVAEDTLFIHTVYRKCRQIKLIPDKLYNYVLYDNSACHGEFNKNRFTELFALQKVIELYADMPEIYNEWQVRYLYTCINMYGKIYESGRKETEEAKYVIKEIRKRFRYIHNVHHIIRYIHNAHHIKVKMHLYLAALSQSLYNLFLSKRLNKKED